MRGNNSIYLIFALFVAGLINFEFLGGIKVVNFCVRGLTLGSGKTKLCVPLSFSGDSELSELMPLLTNVPMDIVEWRADSLSLWADPKSVLSTLRTLRQSLSVPIIFTLRTSIDGGAVLPPPGYYSSLLSAVSQAGDADIIDIELNQGEDTINDILKITGHTNIRTILSYHSFSKTPPPHEIDFTLSKMLSYNADIYKVAYMPKSKSDVTSLMACAVRFLLNNPGKLLISISMGELGAITRIMAGFMGSPLTFASTGTAPSSSAPGQIDASQLIKILNLIE